MTQFAAIFRDRRLRPIDAVIVINMFLVGIMFGFLPLYLFRLGYSAFDSGFALSIATGAYLLVQPLAGILADRFDSRRTVIVGLALASVAVMTTTFTSGRPLIAVVIVAGFGIGTVWTNSDALVSALAAPARGWARALARRSPSRNWETW